MPTIAGLLENNARAACPDDSWPRVRKRLRCAVAALATRRDGPVAVLHDGSLDALAIQLAAIIGGRDVLPVSHPSMLAGLAPAPALICAAPGTVAPQDIPAGADLIAFADLVTFPCPAAPPGPEALSAGSARQAKGALVLAGRHAGAGGVSRVAASSLELSVARLSEALGVGVDDVVSTPAWLGDGLGLILALLAWSAGARLVLPAEGDLLSWAGQCARARVSIAAVRPADLVDLAPALRDVPERLDLSTLRVVLVGSHPAPVTADQLRAFNDAAMESSFDEVALCPAYGTAGDTLIWSMTSASRLWRSSVVSREALSAGRWRQLLTDGGWEVVSCGHPLPGAELRSGDGGPGQAEGAIGSIAVREAGTGEPWQGTGDEGCVSDGELFITSHGAGPGQPA